MRFAWLRAKVAFRPFFRSTSGLSDEAFVAVAAFLATGELCCFCVAVFSFAVATVVLELRLRLVFLQRLAAPARCRRLAVPETWTLLSLAGAGSDNRATGCCSNPTKHIIGLVHRGCAMMHQSP